MILILTKISIFDYKFDIFWPEFQFWLQVRYFLTRILILTEISIFD